MTVLMTAETRQNPQEVCHKGKDCDNETSSDWTPQDAQWNDAARGLQLASGPTPIAVRYAWSNYPQCVLFEHALPVGPFSIRVEVV
jgi:hypothetical protein